VRLDGRQLFVSNYVRDNIRKLIAEGNRGTVSIQSAGLVEDIQSVGPRSEESALSIDCATINADRSSR
jgi:hypothetical protein